MPPIPYRFRALPKAGKRPASKVKPPPKRRKYSVASVSRAGHKTLVRKSGSAGRTTSARTAPRSGGRKSFRRRGLRTSNRKKFTTPGGSHALSGLDASFSNARIGGGPRVYSGFKSRGQRISFNTLLSFRGKTGVGKQLVTTLPTWRVIQQTASGASAATTIHGDASGITAPLLRYCQEQLRRQISQINFQYAASPGMGEGGGSLPAGIRAAKFVIHNMTIMHELKSTSMTPIHITLYDIVLRANTTAASLGHQTNTWRSPITLWEEGLKERKHPLGVEYGNPEGDSTVSPMYQIPFQKPFDSTLFCRTFRVYKTSRMILPPGQTHIHKVVIRPRNMFPLYPNEDANSEDIFARDHLGGIETMTLMVCHGTPVHQFQASAVNVGPASVDVVTKTTCEYQMFDKAFKAVQQFNYMDSSTVITDPRIILEDVDQQATPVGPTTGGMD